MGKRGGAWIGQLLEDILEGTVKNIAGSKLEKVLGGTPPTCCDNELSTCRLIAGKTTDGLLFNACYTPGTSMFYDFDATVANCIINLHYTQADACISVAGSVCGQGYGGGLMTGFVSWRTATKLSADQSRAIQAAANALVGTSVSYDHGSPLMFATFSTENGFEEVEVDFYGHQGQQC